MNESLPDGVQSSNLPLYEDHGSTKFDINLQWSVLFSIPNNHRFKWEGEDSDTKHEQRFPGISG